MLRAFEDAAAAKIAAPAVVKRTRGRNKLPTKGVRGEDGVYRLSEEQKEKRNVQRREQRLHAKLVRLKEKQKALKAQLKVAQAANLQAASTASISTKSTSTKSTKSTPLGDAVAGLLGFGAAVKRKTGQRGPGKKSKLMDALPVQLNTTVQATAATAATASTASAAASAPGSVPAAPAAPSSQPAQLAQALNATAAKRAKTAAAPTAPATASASVALATLAAPAPGAVQPALPAQASKATGVKRTTTAAGISTAAVVPATMVGPPASAIGASEVSTAKQPRRNGAGASVGASAWEERLWGPAGELPRGSK